MSEDQGTAHIFDAAAFECDAFDDVARGSGGGGDGHDGGWIDAAPEHPQRASRITMEDLKTFAGRSGTASVFSGAVLSHVFRK